MTRSLCSDLHAQTDNYQYASYRRAYTLKEALLILVRGGDRVGDEEAGPVSLGLAQLSLSPTLHASGSLSPRRAFHTLCAIHRTNLSLLVSPAKGPPHLTGLAFNQATPVRNDGEFWFAESNVQRST